MHAPFVVGTFALVTWSQVEVIRAAAIAIGVASFECQCYRGVHGYPLC